MKPVSIHVKKMHAQGTCAMRCSAGKECRCTFSPGSSFWTRIAVQCVISQVWPAAWCLSLWVVGDRGRIIDAESLGPLLLLMVLLHTFKYSGSLSYAPFCNRKRMTSHTDGCAVGGWQAHHGTADVHFKAAISQECLPCLRKALRQTPSLRVSPSSWFLDIYCSVNNVNIDWINK